MKAPNVGKAPPAEKKAGGVKFMDDGDDDDSDEAYVPPPKKPEPPRASEVSMASENIRSTGASVAQTPIPESVAVAPPKPESPKEEKKKSIAELAALINPAALGGRASGVSRTTAVTR